MLIGTHNLSGIYRWILNTDCFQRRGMKARFGDRSNFKEEIYFESRVTWGGERERQRDREGSYLSFFHTLWWPVPGQEFHLGLPCDFQTQTLDLPSLAFLSPLAGSLIETGAARLGTEPHKGCQFHRWDHWSQHNPFCITFCCYLIFFIIVWMHSIVNIWFIKKYEAQKQCKTAPAKSPGKALNEICLHLSQSPSPLRCITGEWIRSRGACTWTCVLVWNVGLTGCSLPCYIAMSPQVLNFWSPSVLAK